MKSFKVMKDTIVEGNRHEMTREETIMGMARLHGMDIEAAVVAQRMDDHYLISQDDHYPWKPSESSPMIVNSSDDMFVVNLDALMTNFHGKNWRQKF